MQDLAIHEGSTPAGPHPAVGVRQQEGEVGVARVDDGEVAEWIAVDPPHAELTQRVGDHIAVGDRSGGVTIGSTRGARHGRR